MTQKVKLTIRKSADSEMMLGGLRFEACRREIEKVDGVDFVDKIRLYDEGQGDEVEQMKLRDDQLLYVVDVTVGEKAHERIV